MGTPFGHFWAFLAFCMSAFSARILDRLDKRLVMIFRRFRGAFGRLFGSLFKPKREKEKVCLDCTGVCGLHIQLSGKCTFPRLFQSLFLKHCAGGHFDTILVFLELPRGTLGLHFGGRGCKKMRSEKMTQNRFEKGGSVHTAQGLWAP